MSRKTAIVIGAGIVGLATARALSEKGFQVEVFDRSSFAVGASIRNFGMVWPVGQPSGKLYQRAINSRNIWKAISEEGAFWHDPVGSLHLVYEQDEWQVLQELYEAFKLERPVSLLNPTEVAKISPCAITQNLKGALYSKDEVIVDPRKAIGALPAYLQEKYGVVFHWNTAIVAASLNTIETGNGEKFHADLILICSGADFETLFASEYAKLPITKCKLQMMRLHQPIEPIKIGPALCGALSLAHYKSFEAAPSLIQLKHRFQTQFPEHMKWGIHVMVSQNEELVLTVGDTHEYGLTFDPFDRSFLNEMVTDYLKSFASFPHAQVIETWNGIYPKMKNGATEIHFEVEPGIHVINGLGGAGMTLSFGLAEEVVASL